MRHFNYFENGGPAPSSCVSCGRGDQLFDLGRELLMGGMAQICKICVTELAVFNGFAEKAPLDEVIIRQEEHITKLEADLAKVPNLVDGLINGIRSSVTDFIFAVSYSDDGNQPEPIQNIASSDSRDHKADKAAAGQRKAPVKSISE